MPREKKVIREAREGKMSDEAIARLAGEMESEKDRAKLESILDEKGYEVVSTNE